LFVTWKKVVNGGEPHLRGCIGTLEAQYIITGFRDYALTRYCCVLYPNYVAVIYISVELWISLPLHVKKAYTPSVPFTKHPALPIL
jgi:hypothetical protein